MVVNSEVGKLAGTIWRLLENKGSMGLTELRASIVTAPYLIEFALGWLAREGRVEIFEENAEVKIRALVTPAH